MKNKQLIYNIKQIIIKIFKNNFLYQTKFIKSTNLFQSQYINNISKSKYHFSLNTTIRLKISQQIFLQTKHKQIKQCVNNTFVIIIKNFNYQQFQLIHTKDFQLFCFIYFSEILVLQNILQWCNVTQYDLQPDEIQNLGTKITVSQEGAQQWFNDRIVTELARIYGITVNNLQVSAGPFKIYVNDLHLQDIQIEPLKLSFENDHIVASFSQIYLNGQFNYKIQQEVYPYISISSTAQAYGYADGSVLVSGDIDQECPNFIQTNTHQTNINIQGFTLNLNLDGAIGAIIQGFLEYVVNEFIDGCFEYVTKISTTTTRFSLAEPDNLLWTDLRYLDLQTTQTYLSISLPGNICINNGTNIYDNQSVAVCKGWHMNNSKLIDYYTNDNLQYLVNRYQFQGIFDSLNENNLLNYTIKEEFAHTGGLMNIEMEDGQIYQFLTSIQANHIQQTWKIVTLKLYLQINQQLDENQLDDNEIQGINQFISQHGVGYQDASYIDYEKLHTIYISDEWALVTTQFIENEQSK